MASFCQEQTPNLTENENMLGHEHTGSIHHLDQPILIPESDAKNEDVDQEAHEVNTEVIKYLDEELAGIAISEKVALKLHCSTSTVKIITGLVIVVCIAVSWTGATQFGKSTYSPHFKAPFFTTWFTTCFNVFVYPVFMIPLACKKTPWRLRTFLRKSASIFGPSGFCVRSLLHFGVKVILPFLIVWLLTNTLYFLSLKKLLPGTVAATFSSTSAFVYILSLIFLKDKIYFLRLFSVLMSIGGIVLMSYSEGFGSSSAVGVAFVVLAALGSAFYQVMFKVVLGKASGAQVALFITLLGIVNLVMFWPVVVFMDFMNYEVIQWDDLPWKYLAGTALLGVIFNYLVNFGISVTYPLFISIGTLLGVPLSAAVDAVFRHSGFGIYKIFALLMILGGFMLMLVPNKKVEKCERKMTCRENNSEDSVRNV